MNYLDTSALIKRFVTEKGSGLIQALVTGDEPVATAKIAYAEIYAGLTRSRWGGDLSHLQYTLACRQFEYDWRAYVLVDLRDEILVLARELIQRQRLKGVDAVHLASALSLKSALGQDIIFVAADARLLRSAQAERLRTLNAETAHAP